MADAHRAPGSCRSARPPDADVRAERRRARRPRPRRVRRCVTPAGAAPVALRLHRRAPGRERAGRRRRRRSQLGLPLGRGRRGAARAAGPPAAGGWRCTERADGVTVVNDAYNANPDSMRAALEALAAIGRGGAAHAGRCSARCASSATTPRPSTTRSGGCAVARSASTGSSSSARARAADRIAAPRHEGSWGEESVVRAGRRRGASSCCARASRPGDVVLVKASRGAGLRAASPTALLDRRRERAREADPARRRPRRCSSPCSARRCAIRVPRAARLRPGDPRRRPDHATTPSAARRPWAASSSSSRVAARLLRWRTLITLARADRVRRCCVLFLFVGLGARRLPRRLHQDLQAAQPRAAQQGQAGRPDGGRAGRSASWRSAVPGRPRPAPRRRTHISFLRDIAARAADGRWSSLLDLGDRSPAPATGEPHRRPRRPGHRRAR